MSFIVKLRYLVFRNNFLFEKYLKNFKIQNVLNIRFDNKFLQIHNEYIDNLR